MSATHPALQTAKDIMTRDLITAEANMTLREFAHMLDEFEVSGAPVVDSSGHLIGVASKSDLLHRAMDPDMAGVEPRFIFDLLYPDDDDNEVDEREDEELDNSDAKPLACVGDFMTEDPVTAGPDEPIASLARKMIDGHIHRIIVVDSGNCPIGIVTSLDMLKVLTI